MHVSAQTPMILPMTRILWFTCLGGCFSDNLHVYVSFFLVNICRLDKPVGVFACTETTTVNKYNTLVFVNEAHYDMYYRLM